MFENYKHNETSEIIRPLNEAVQVAYNKMDICFKSDVFVLKVREITRKELKEQTILNSLRQKRKNGLLNYVILDSSRGEYKKSRFKI